MSVGQQDGKNIGKNQLQFGESVEGARSAVWRLLNYAISDANIDIDKEKPGLIETVSPILNKNPDQLSNTEIASLFTAYNDLSQLVYPATNESLWLKEQAEKDDRYSILGQPISSARKKIKNIYCVFILVLCAAGVTTFLVQGYTSFLSDSLQKVQELESSLKGIEDQIIAAKNARSTVKGDDDVNLYDVFPIKDLLTQKDAVWRELNGNYCALGKLDFLNIRCNSPSDSASAGLDFAPLLQQCQQLFEEGIKKCQTNPVPAIQDLAGQLGECDKKPKLQRPKCKDKARVKNKEELATLDKWKKQREECEKYPNESKNSCERTAKRQQRENLNKQEAKEKAERNNYFAKVKAFLRILNYLLLPTLLGLLGASAFVIRNILDNIKQSSLMLNFFHRWIMRVVLGASLGLISGIIISPDLNNFQEASFSPLVWGFLMGYSVEFAFSLFDGLIQKGRDAFGPTTTKAASTGSNPIAPPTSPPNVKAITPNQGPTSGGTIVAITGAGFTNDAKVYFGPTLANNTTVTDGTVITATSPAGEGPVYVTVVTDKGKSADDAASQFTYTMEGESLSDGCDFEVSDEDVTYDHQLPAAEGGVA